MDTDKVKDKFAKMLSETKNSGLESIIKDLVFDNAKEVDWDRVNESMEKHLTEENTVIKESEGSLFVKRAADFIM